MSLAISISQYVKQINDGVLSSEEFIAKTLERINKVDKTIHAFISVNESALEQAKQIDKKLKLKEKVGACLGMPISIKDNICTKGIKTTCASKMLEDFVAPYDATV
ncbi:MAG TPA: amidase family protein, partial [Nitrosopumilaceae archaeon]|nr:amidase family protein [Nitrosopumilaceae archaeon]